VLAVTMLGIAAVSLACDKDKSAQASATAASRSRGMYEDLRHHGFDGNRRDRLQRGRHRAAMEGCSGMKSADVSACSEHHKVSATRRVRITAGA